LMADAPALVTVEAANTANDPAAPRFGAASVFATMAIEDGAAAVLDAVRDVGGLAAATVVARVTASDSSARVRIPVFMNFSCLMHRVKLSEQIVTLRSRSGEPAPPSAWAL
jgi:hypothetical protein